MQRATNGIPGKAPAVFRPLAGGPVSGLCERTVPDGHQTGTLSIREEPSELGLNSPTYTDSAGLTF